MFFQAVYVPERCFLSEALLWVAFQRLPTVQYDEDNREIREATEYQGYALDTPEGPLTEDESKRAGIPPDPSYLRLIDENPGPLQKHTELEIKVRPCRGNASDPGGDG